MELTRGGNKNGPPYQILVDWCSKAWSDLDIKIIKKSFIQTGVNNEGNVDPNNLHSKLQDLLADVSPEELQKKVDQEKENVRTDLTENEEIDSEEDEDNYEDLLDI